MKRIVISLAVLAPFMLIAGVCRADLVDAGTGGDCFFDQDTGITWFDPANFANMTRPDIDALVTGDPNAIWATSAQIDGLLGKSTEGGIPLEDVMGARQFTLSDGGPRWIGYYVQEAQPDGWLAQSYQVPGYDTINGTGFQGNVAQWNPGAWVIKIIPTAVEPGTWGAIRNLYR